MKISSKDKKILVVSDIHHEINKLKNIIKREKPDNVIVLGDWFDSFYYNLIEDAATTARYLKKFIYRDGNYTLFGNHDLHYFYTNNHLKCSGYTAEKDSCITEVLDPKFQEIRQKFLWYIWIDDFLCTHAGVHPDFIDPYVKNIDDMDKFLQHELSRTEPRIKSGDAHWMYMAGKYRGGKQKYGGITWQDYDHEFAPVDGFKQIFGHTYSNYVRQHDENNYCIDCLLNQYLIIENGKVNICKSLDL